MINKDIILTMEGARVRKLLLEGKRADNRKLDEYRDIEIKTNVFKNAEGSAIARIGETKVYAGVKLQLGEPYPDNPDEGTISVGAELLPMASPTFEYGPPSPETTELARIVDRPIRESKAIDFKKLCIKEGELVWIAYLDLYIVNDDGNVIDASSLAAVSALLTSKIPKLDENNKKIKGEYSGKFPISAKPLLLTVRKTGTTLFMDPSLEEEEAVDARLSIGVFDGKLSALQKGLPGSFTKDEIMTAVDMALNKSKELLKYLPKE